MTRRTQFLWTGATGAPRRIVPALLLIAATTAFQSHSLANSPKLDARLIKAVNRGDLETAQELISQGADVDDAMDQGGYNPLMVASKQGHLDMAELLIRSGAGVNAADALGRTSLMFAANEAVAGLLLSRGASVNDRDDRQMTALCFAVQQARTGIVRLLLEHGANASARCHQMRTPLDWIMGARGASKNERMEIVKLLLAHDADVNARDSYGWTPLISAAKLGRLDVLQLLLAQPGIDVHIRRQDGLTALDVAKGRAKRLIAEAGGKPGEPRVARVSVPLTDGTYAATFDLSVLDVQRKPGAEHIKLAIQPVTFRDVESGVFSTVTHRFRPTENFPKMISSALRRGFANMGFQIVENDPDLILGVKIESVDASTWYRLLLDSRRGTAVVRVVAQVIDGTTREIVCEQRVIGEATRSRASIQGLISLALDELFGQFFSNRHLNNALLTGTAPPGMKRIRGELPPLRERK